MQNYQLMFKKRNTVSKPASFDDINQSDSQELGKPQKKSKVQKTQINNMIGGSTEARKVELEQNVHKQFESLQYKRGQASQQILVGEQAVTHQTEEAKRLYLQNVEITKKIKQGKLSTNIYRGANNYANYKLSANELENPQQNYKWKHGPVKDSKGKESGAKNTCRFDYDPSRCKDWFVSGYCVFGNSCIYSHDRSNYKTGWQMEKDYEKGQKQRIKRLENRNSNEEPDYIKDLEKYKPQQICKYCNEALKEPVEVSCLHIFCRKCAGKIIQKQSKCVDCNKKLNGIMNNADKIISKQKQTYDDLMAMALQTNEKNQTKRSRYRDVNSLEVFAE